MATILDLEQTLLQTVRSLPNDKQEAVLLFACSLQSSPLPLSYSLLELAKLPIAERNAFLAPYIPLMAEDFRADPALTEFEMLDLEDWEE
jgi:hypothetical protein